MQIPSGDLHSSQTIWDPPEGVGLVHSSSYPQISDTDSRELLDTSSTQIPLPLHRCLIAGLIASCATREWDQQHRAAGTAGRQVAQRGTSPTLGNTMPPLKGRS